jgi:ABC-type lipoprotein export system ATPase subunit
MNSSPPTLDVRGLSRAVERGPLWTDLSFVVPSGSSLALTGPSGSGKTTLLRCLATLAHPDSGTIRFGDQRLDGLTGKGQREFLRSTCGLVFQDYALVGEWSVSENMRVVRPRGVPKSALAQRERDALLRVGLAGRGNEPTSRLSGGEQQRVAIARLLVQSPALVIADEPTAALDSMSAERVRRALGALRDSGSVVLVATHDPTLVEWCDARLALDALPVDR